MAGLLNLDWSIFRWFNQELASPVLDRLAPFLSDQKTWWVTAVVLLGLSFLLKKWAWTRAILMGALVLGLTDAFASQVIKPAVGRVRPCHQTEVRLVTGHCGGLNGFPSNHAANGAAVAAVVAGFLSTSAFAVTMGIVVLVGLSRIYLGVHFASDVLAGFILGGLMGMSANYLLRKYFNRIYQT